MLSIKNKRVWTGVPQSTHVTTRKSRRTPTATAKLEHKKSKATSSVLLSKMTVKLEITLSTTLKTRTKHKSQFSSHLAEKESAEYYAVVWLTVQSNPRLGCFHAVPWVALYSVFVAFPDYIHLFIFFVGGGGGCNRKNEWFFIILSKFPLAQSPQITDYYLKFWIILWSLILNL